jgi:hypothetical protein
MHEFNVFLNLRVKNKEKNQRKDEDNLVEIEIKTN